MNHFEGTAGDDVLTGTKHKDYFDLSQGGHDKASGLDGDDIFYLGGALDAYDRLDGGTGADVLELDGNYSNLVLRVHSLVSIEAIQFDPGFSYRLKTNDANVAAGRTLAVNGAALRPHDNLSFNGSAETDGRFKFTSGAGNNTFWGGAGNDRFNLTQGGVDKVHGGGGVDIFILGGTLTSADRIDGGAKADHLVLDGDYSGAHSLELVKNNVKSVSIFAVRSGHDYDITADNGAFGTVNQTTNIVSYTFGPGDSLTFDASAETTLSFRFLPNDGTYDLSGGEKNDQFLFGEHFNSNDVLNGGQGNDTLVLNGSFQHPNLNGNYTGSNAITIGAGQLTSIETLSLVGGYNYHITTSGDAVAGTNTLKISATGFDTQGTGTRSGDLPALSAGDSFYFNGSSETTGHFIFDIAGSHDNITGGAQQDTFSYIAKPSSDGATYDTINAFDFSTDGSGDLIKLSHAITATDTTVTTGALSSQSFDSDLVAAMASSLGPDHAVLFQPDSGTFSGSTFLIIDQNGTAGFQLGSDLVVELVNPLHMDQFGTADFTT